MFEIIDTLIGMGLAYGAANYYVNRKKKQELEQKISEIKTEVIGSEVTVPAAIKRVDTETVQRLDALEDLLQSNQPMGISTELVLVKVLYITDGIRFHFHYLHRPQPFLTLTFNKSKQHVLRDYVMEELTQDKKRVKEIIKQLSDKIIAEYGEVNETLQQLEENPDPVFKKAYSILTHAKQLQTVILPSELEQITTNVEKVLAAYEPLKEETKKACQDEVFLALGKIETRLQGAEQTIENEKMQRLKEEIDGL